MPLPTARLSKDSSEDEIRQAISDTISQLIDEGRDRDQAIAIAYDSARRQTGKSLGRAQRLKGKSTRHTA